ncbi:hemolysin family protein [Limnohabitans sp.]|uniref:hemolysin family protein n=1 Tax=Limnohabitans sp. TaxID=1907725 RepID=UPI00333F0658
MDVLLIVFLTLLNGMFAMSEMALSSSRKARLAALAEAGDSGAHAALRLMEQPTQFLSTVQIGITSIGVLNGIVGEAAFSADFSYWLLVQGVPDNWASGLATAFVVTIITFSTILFGELVPKRIGQLFPETVARLAAPAMLALATLAKPFVYFLSASTSAILKLLRVDVHGARTVTEEEISASLVEGVDAGLIELHEHQMVQNVFNLDERPLTSIMVHRSDIEWLDSKLPVPQALAQVGASGAHSWYPVCRGDLDNVVGAVSVSQLLRLPPGTDTTVEALAKPVAFVPETLSGMDLLEQFRKPAERATAHGRMVLVVDEYGVVQGLLTPRDLLEAITGELLQATPTNEAWATQREDGSWLVDGMMPVTEFKARLGIKELPDEDRGIYNTVAGLVMAISGELPAVADVVIFGEWRFEVVDLDGRRIDKLLISCAD